MRQAGFDISDTQIITRMDKRRLLGIVIYTLVILLTEHHKMHCWQYTYDNIKSCGERERERERKKEKKTERERERERERESERLVTTTAMRLLLTIWPPCFIFKLNNLMFNIYIKCKYGTRISFLVMYKLMEHFIKMLGICAPKLKYLIRLAGVHKQAAAA